MHKGLPKCCGLYQRRILSPCVSRWLRGVVAGHCVRLWLSRIFSFWGSSWGKTLCETRRPPGGHQGQEAGGNLECSTEHLVGQKSSTLAYVWLAKANHVVEPRLGWRYFWLPGTSASPTVWVGCWTLVHFSGGGGASIIGDCDLIYLHALSKILYFVSKGYWEWCHCFVLFHGSGSLLLI